MGSFMIVFHVCPGIGRDEDKERKRKGHDSMNTYT